MNIFDYGFDKKEISLEEFQISHEMIAPQLNDEVLPLYIKELDSILDYIERKNVTSDRHAKVLKDTEFKKHVEAIEEITFKRFGFHIKILDGGLMTPAACFPVPPKEFNVLTHRSNEDMYNQIKKEKSKTSKSFDSVEYEVVKRVSDSVKALNNVLNTKGFKVDLQKAKIIGLPDEYCIAMLFNFATLFTYGFGSREILAIFLHEIGHAFTHLESSYRYLANTTVLIDTFISNLHNKNKTPRESLTIAYKKVTGDKSIDKLKDSNKLVFYITTGKRLTDYMLMSSTPHSSIDSEQQADQFAARFGLGEELTKSLSVLHKSNTGYFAMFMYFVIGLLNFIMCAAAPGFIMIFGPIGTICLVALYKSIFKKNNVYTSYTYDDEIQRLRRIRNESVRLLRLSNIDKDTVSNVLYTIDQIDNMIESTREGWVGPIDKIYQTFFTTGKQKLELKQLEELTEKLMENDLHIVKHKLDSLR